MKKSIVAKILILISMISLMSCATDSSSLQLTSTHSAENNSAKTFWEKSPGEIWNQLQPSSPKKLLTMQSKTSDINQLAWIDLALISKRSNTTILAQDLLSWRARNPFHPANQLLPDDASLRALQANLPHQIAILLPQQGQFAASGQFIREGFLHAYYNNAPKIGKQNVKFYDTTQSASIASVYQQALLDGADVVVGPITKDAVQTLRQQGNFNVPTIALNYSAQDGTRSTNFYEFGLSPEDETSQLASHAYGQGLRRALVIAPQNSRGTRLANALIHQWQTLGGSVQGTYYFSANNNFDFNQSIAQLLQAPIETDPTLIPDAKPQFNQRRHDFDVIFLLAQPTEGTTIVSLLRYYHAGDMPIYASSSIYSVNSAKNMALDNIIICETSQLRKISSDEFSKSRLYAVGQDAYRLSQSIPQLTQLSTFPIYGITGALVLSDTHQIHRRIPCTSIAQRL